VTTLELPVPAVPAPRAARAPHRRAHAGSAPIRLAVSGRALVLVAGMPGAGKSTLLAGLRRDPGTVVLDSDDHRVALARRFPRLPYRRYRALVHLRHRAAVVRAAFSDASTVVVHLPATSTVLRSAVALVAATTGRTAHLLWLHVDPAEALRGQRDRGRLIPSASFAGHVRRAEAATAALREGRAIGWRTVTVADRSAARAGLVLDPSPCK
jgi:adenylylsulfate kinase-like enzyme